MEDRVPSGKLTRYELMLPTDIKLISTYIKYGVLKIWIHLKIIFKNLWRPQQIDALDYCPCKHFLKSGSACSLRRHPTGKKCNN